MEWYMGKYIRPLSDAVFTIASDDLWIESLAIQQLHTTANLPNMQRVVGMPDLHPDAATRLAQRSSLLVVFTRQDVAVTVLETETGRYSDTLRSALVSLDGDNAWALSESWCGTIQWICPSPYRPHHGRKTGFWALGVLPLMSRNNRMQSVMRRCVRRGRAVNMSIKPTRRYAPRIWHPVLA
ncbi:peptide chain release factor H [Escherichia coli]|uniref:Peptide chain release factor H n=1 Tax=Escherichia coli TaxID=562 RepID=A0A377DWQ6_ECOLX|nr:peptide chain release factor H [Escherichia coli]